MDELDKPQPRRSKHAEKRKTEGRPVNEALKDAQRATQSDVFIQRNGYYVLRLRSAREHIFKPNGEIETTFIRSNKAHLKIVQRGDRRPVTEEEFKRFKEIFG